MAMPASREAPSVGGNGTAPKGKPEDLNARFFRYFQQEITALQEQMDRLGSTAIVSGERADALDHCLAGISRLSSEVKDASSYIPSYDQRIYADAIKALQDKLARTKESIAPRTKFVFKTARKNPSAVSLADAAQLEAQVRRYIPGYTPGDRSLEQTSLAPAPQDTSAAAGVNGHKDGSTPVALSASVESSAVFVNAHTDRHIVLPVPESQAALSASMTSLRNCVVDMFVPTVKAVPFANMTIKDVSTSLLLCGQVNGAAHVTNVQNSVIVISARQFRMHDCKDVNVYLSCSSCPIIENCTGIRFGQIPKPFTTDPNSLTSLDMWFQVEDFKWLKSEPSPNWSLLDQATAISENVWVDISASVPGLSLDNILKAVGVVKS